MTLLERIAEEQDAGFGATALDRQRQLEQDQNANPPMTEEVTAMPEIGIADIERLAEEAANLFCMKETEEASNCFDEACQLGGPFIASTTFVTAFALRAAQARLVDDRGGVSRLKENAYNICPDIFSKQDVNDIFKAAGACGHKPPKRRSEPVRGMLQTVKG